MSELSVPVERRPSSGVRLVPLRLLGDDRLRELAAAGDRRAFVAIYERYHQGLFGYCRSILRNEEDARDALQNVMARVLRGLDGEHRQIAMKPWLYRVAHNECMSLLRRRRHDVDLDTATDVPDASGADLVTRERLRELVGDLRELPDQQRGALVMRELNGLEYAEIGAAFGITPAAATQAVYDARRGLHEMAEGRAMDCESIRRVISANDRRSLRARRVRGHLRACGGCRDFQAALSQRPKDLTALAPALPAPAAAALLHSVSAGATGTGGTGGMAALAAGTGKTAAYSAVVKGVTVVAVAATVGTGAVAVRHQIANSQPPSPSLSTSGSSPRTSPARATPAATRPHMGGASGSRTSSRRPHAAARSPHQHAGGATRQHLASPGTPARLHTPGRSGVNHPPSGSGRANGRVRQPDNTRRAPGLQSHPTRPPQSQHQVLASPAPTGSAPGTSSAPDSAAAPTTRGSSGAHANGVGPSQAGP